MKEQVVGHFVFLVPSDRLLVFRVTWAYATSAIGGGLILASAGTALVVVSHLWSEVI